MLFVAFNFRFNVVYFQVRLSNCGVILLYIISYIVNNNKSYDEGKPSCTSITFENCCTCKHCHHKENVFQFFEMINLVWLCGCMNA